MKPVKPHMYSSIFVGQDEVNAAILRNRYEIRLRFRRLFCTGPFHFLQARRRKDNPQISQIDTDSELGIFKSFRPNTIRNFLSENDLPPLLEICVLLRNLWTLFEFSACRGE